MYGKHHLLERLTEFRHSLLEVVSYTQTSVPLAYTQVVHLAVYIFFGISLLADQWIIWRQPGDEEVDLIYPFFMAFKFLFIFGWLRVAETLYNPFGEDDEDFDLSDLLGRHFRAGLEMVEDRPAVPPLSKGDLWFHTELPDTAEANINIDIQDIKDIIDQCW